MPRIPFVRGMRDDSASTARISDLMRMRGSQQANAIAEAGARSGQMWQDVGRNVSGVVSDLLRAKAYEDEQQPIREERARETSIRDAVRMTPRDEQTGRLDPERIADEVAHIDPVKALDWWRMADAEKKAQLVTERAQVETAAKAAGSLLSTLKRADPAEHQPMWTAARAKAIEDGLLPEPGAMPEQVDLGWLQQTFDQARSVSDISRELERIGQADDEEGVIVGPGQELRGKRTGKVIARGPEKTADPARTGTFEDYVTRLEGEKGGPLSRTDILAARRQWTDAGRAPQGGTVAPNRRERNVALRAYQGDLTQLEKDARAAVAAVERRAADPMLDVDLDAEKQAVWDRLDEDKARAEASYYQQIDYDASGDPVSEPEPALVVERPPPGTRAIAERGDVGPPPGAPGRRAVAPPLSAAPAAAAPAPRQAPKVGDVVTVRGQRVRITGVRPDGQFVVEPVP